MNEILIPTHAREEWIRLDSQLSDVLDRESRGDGILLLHVPHTTCGLTINENGDPDVPRDLQMKLREAASDARYRHAEGNSDAHLKSSLVGCQLWLPVVQGRLRLGTWQSVWFCEFDGPRQRRLWADFLPRGASV